MFLALSVKFLHKLLCMDHKRALPVLTQLDYWTYLIDLLQPTHLAHLEKDENRLILKAMKSTLLRWEDPCKQFDSQLMVCNSVLELVFEGFKRDA